MIKKGLLLIIGVLFILGIRPCTLVAQGVAINPDGSVAAESAMLDIKSTSKGLLIPRINITDLSSSAPVTSPEVSLLVYNTNTSTGLGYYYWTGTKWMRLTIAEDLDYVNGSGDATRVAFWTNTNTLGSNAKLFWDNTNERLGIGTDAPEFRFTVIDSTGIIADTTLFGATGVFENRSIDEWALGLAGISESSPGKGVGVGGLGGRCGVVGRSFQEGAGERIGIFGQLVDLNADYKYAILGIASGEGINCGIYGMASGGTYNWAGFFENDVCIQTKLIIGQVGTPQAQLQTTGSVRFQTLSGSGNRFVMTDANGNLSASNAAGSGIVSGSGTTNYIPKWTPDGNTLNNSQIFDNGTYVGIGTTNPQSQLHVNSGSVRISGSTNTNAETGGKLIYSNASGLGGGTAQKVERYSKLTMASDNSYVIYDDYAVTLYAYRSSDNYYIRLAPKSGYTGWWDYSEESAGNNIYCSTAGTQYTMSSDWGVSYTGGFEIVINRESNNTAPTYRIRPHLHSSTDKGYASIIVEAYYP